MNELTKQDIKILREMNRKPNDSSSIVLVIAILLMILSITLTLLDIDTTDFKTMANTQRTCHGTTCYGYIYEHELNDYKMLYICDNGTVKSMGIGVNTCEALNE